MKKIIGLLIIITYIVLVLSMSYFDFQFGSEVQISAVFLILAFIVLFETKELNSKTMAVIATMSALGGVMRVPFAAIPGFQPVTFICAVSGYTLGSINGFMVGSMCAFISNFFLGHGPWTLWQMMAWGLCGVCFGVLRKVIKKTGIKGFIICCGIWGYIYGIILDQWYIVEFIRPITIKAIISGIVLSFPQDTIHAIGNVIFAVFFGRSFIKVLERYNKKNKIEYIDDEFIKI
ncbi:ECF transporter S component [Clostridium aestuarii]|uniref:ECF transporter S component n=1 Tax=Clostridium aestuarii TaxID=338193 RepID=A0ABT4CYF9_9CLOT|nr:ECF transporter S component [Clostridium aestuarii]MCY6482843.1 ECF transporter S component [Clostridium aestuarii]